MKPRLSGSSPSSWGTRLSLHCLPNWSHIDEVHSPDQARGDIKQISLLNWLEEPAHKHIIQFTVMRGLPDRCIQEGEAWNWGWGAGGGVCVCVRVCACV